MKVHFWGTRGSIPGSLSPLAVRQKIRAALTASRSHALDTDEALDRFIDSSLPFHVRAAYGANTACMEIIGGPDFVVCDAGSGIRDFGNAVMLGAPSASGRTFHIFLSHLHWDHIQGFPFFVPAYVPGNTIIVYACHEGAADALLKQQEPPFFPVPLSYLKGDIRFVRLEPGRQYSIAQFKVTCIRQTHPGDSYGYRFEKDGKSVVYSTDSEYRDAVIDDGHPMLGFFKDADLLVFDAQYELLDAVGVKSDWGHSSNVIGVELALRARAKRLCLFHNDPTFDDARLDDILADTRAYQEIAGGSSSNSGAAAAGVGEGEGGMLIDIAYDGLEIEL